MALKDQLPLDDETTILQHLSQLQIRFAPGDPEQRVFMNDEDVTLAIREPDVTNNVSQVAALPGVRTELVERQRDIAAKHDIVMDGRDIGTTVLRQAADAIRIDTTRMTIEEVVAKILALVAEKKQAD